MPLKTVPIPFPIGGFSESFGRSDQPPRTTPSCNNVMPFDTAEDRARGGQRPGTKKRDTSQVNGSNSIQHMAKVVRSLGEGFPDLASAATVDEDFTGSSGVEIQNGDSDWDEFEGTAAATDPATDNAPIDLDSDIADGSGLFEYNASNKAIVNFTGTEDAASQVRLLRHNTDYPIGTGDYVYAVRVKITLPTVPSGGSSFKDVLHCGILLRCNSTNVHSLNEYIFVGAHRPYNASSNANWTVHISHINEVADVTEIGTNYDIGSSSDTDEHQIEVRIQGNTLWVFWDNRLIRISQYTTSRNRTNSDFFKVGLYCSHKKEASRTTIEPIFDDFEIWDATTSATGTDEQLVVVAGGSVYLQNADDVAGFQTFIDSANSSTSGLDASVRYIRSTEFNQRLYLIEGLNYRYYDFALGRLLDWDADTNVTASAGTLPGGNQSDTTPDPNDFGANTSTPDAKARCTMIISYFGCIVMSGKADDPANVFFSAINDANNWDLTSGLDGAAFTANASTTLGRVDDTITFIKPFFDTTMLIGGRSSMKILTNHPDWGGKMNVLSSTIGIAGPDAGVIGSDKAMYVFTSEGSLMRIFPGEFNVDQSNSLSEGKIRLTFQAIDQSANNIRLVWDTKKDGLWIFVEPTVAGSTTHYFWSRRANSFWPQSFPNNTGPSCAIEFQSLKSNKSRLLLGTFDGYIFEIDDSTTNDVTAASTTPISSELFIGPIATNYPDEHKLISTQGILDEGSNDVTLGYATGDTAENALSATPKSLGTLSAGRTHLGERAGGVYGFYKLTNSTASETWQLEQLLGEFAPGGRARSR